MNTPEDFYHLERWIVLQSIDELWMRHIDSMARLRESVAFEWYAQRNPLVVYKEKAFEKFDTLISEIAYKTTKAIFSIKQNIVINQIQLDEQNMIVSNNEDSILEILPETKNNSNPLFNTWNDGESVKIRV